MSSVLNVDTIADKAGTGPVALTKQSAAKAWSNFDGSGTVATRDSFNQSSLTDNNSGRQSIGYTNNMNDTNYSATACASLADGNADSNAGIASPARNTTTPLTTSGMSLLTTYNTADFNTFSDMKIVCVHVMGDLA